MNIRDSVEEKSTKLTTLERVNLESLGIESDPSIEREDSYRDYWYFCQKKLIVISERAAQLVKNFVKKKTGKKVNTVIS